MHVDDRTVPQIRASIINLLTGNDRVRMNGDRLCICLFVHANAFVNNTNTVALDEQSDDAA